MACLKDDVEAAFLHGRACDVVAVPQNLAVRGVRDAEQDVKRRGLAASGRSQHRDDLSVLDGEVDVVQNAVFRIRLADMVEFGYRAPLVNWPSSKRAPRVRAYTGTARMRGAGA